MNRCRSWDWPSRPPESCKSTRLPLFRFSAPVSPPTLTLLYLYRYRMMDTLAMIDWLNTLYATSSADKGKQVDVGGEEASPSEDDGSLLKLEKAQAWSMLCCAPLELTGESLASRKRPRTSGLGADLRSTRRISLPGSARLPTDQGAASKLDHDVVGEVLGAVHRVVSRLSWSRQLGDS